METLAVIHLACQAWNIIELNSLLHLQPEKLRPTGCQTRKDNIKIEGEIKATQK